MLCHSPSYVISISASHTSWIILETESTRKSVTHPSGSFDKISFRYILKSLESPWAYQKRPNAFFLYPWRIDHTAKFVQGEWQMITNSYEINKYNKTFQNTFFLTCYIGNEIWLWTEQSGYCIYKIGIENKEGSEYGETVQRGERHANGVIVLLYCSKCSPTFVLTSLTF